MKLKQRASVVLITCMMLVSAGGEAFASPPPPMPRLDTMVQAEGVTLSWSLPPVEIAAGVDGQLQATMHGLELDNQPGYPQVPVANALIALPVGAEPEISLIRANEKLLPQSGSLTLAPEPDGVVKDTDGNILRGAYRPVQDQPAGHSLQPVQIEDLGLLRGVHLARVSLRPVLPEQGGLRVMSSAQVQIHFKYLSGQKPSVSESELQQDPILQFLKDEVANPQHLPAAYQPPAEEQASWPDPLPAKGKVAIEVETTGLVKVTLAALQSAGFPVSQVNRQKLHLLRGTTEIPFEYVSDSANGDWLMFYAEPRFSRWTRAETYYLFETETNSPAMPTRSAVPAPSDPTSNTWLEQKFEVNQIYSPYFIYGHMPTGPDGDRWVWDALTYPGDVTGTYTYTLPGLNPTLPATLTLWMIGYTDLVANPDHQVNVSANASSLGTVQWDGKTLKEATWSIQANTLQTGNNHLDLQLPGIVAEVEGSWLDAFQVRYAAASSLDFPARLIGQAKSSTYQFNASQSPTVFDVTDPNQPIRLTGSWNSGVYRFKDPETGGRRYFFQPAGAGYVAPANIRLVQALESPHTNQVQYLIITHPDFRTEADRLAARRQAQGFTVAVEEVDRIYDAYSAGEPTPEAIRAFIENGYNTPEWALSYVVLLGDGTVDPKHYRSNSANTFIPPYLADVDPWAGETAADNRFVTVQGEDVLPDLSLGRLPANSIDEARTMIDKIIRYEDSAGSAWMNNWLFIADDPETSQVDQSLLDFPGFQNQLIDQVQKSSSIIPTRLFYSSGADIDAFQQSLLNSWNQGKGFIVYNGHSSIHFWAAEEFFHYNDIPKLNGGDKLSILLEMTCFTGAFHWSYVQTLDESLLRYPDGGTAAVWGSTGLGITEGQAVMSAGFMDELLSEPVARLGPATLHGKLDLLLEKQVYADLVETFTLLGDPATQITQKTQPHQFLPTILK